MKIIEPELIQALYLVIASHNPNYEIPKEVPPSGAYYVTQAEFNASYCKYRNFIERERGMLQTSCNEAKGTVFNESSVSYINDPKIVVNTIYVVSDDPSPVVNTSRVLHELVHYIQIFNGRRARGCMQYKANEWEAYEIQRKYLLEHGLSYDFSNNLRNIKCW